MLFQREGDILQVLKALCFSTLSTFSFFGIFCTLAASNSCALKIWYMCGLITWGQFCFLSRWAVRIILSGERGGVVGVLPSCFYY